MFQSSPCPAEKEMIMGAESVFAFSFEPKCINENFSKHEQGDLKFYHIIEVKQ